MSDAGIYKARPFVGISSQDLATAADITDRNPSVGNIYNGLAAAGVVEEDRIGLTTAILTDPSWEQWREARPSAGDLAVGVAAGRVFLAGEGSNG